MSIPPPSQAPDHISLVIDWGADLDSGIPSEIDEDLSATRPVRRSRLRKIVIVLAAVGALFAWIQRFRRRRAMA
jgi:hypothetical protein